MKSMRRNDFLLSILLSQILLITQILLKPSLIFVIQSGIRLQIICDVKDLSE